MGAPLVTVAAITDGDTLELADGRSVRLVQIDTPELGEGECYAQEASEALRTLVPVGRRVRLRADARLDTVDRYGRLLRYVFRGSTNVNLELVRRGAASVWFYDGDRGRYASQLMEAAMDARAADRGLWAACPGTVLDPSRGVNTFPAAQVSSDNAEEPTGCQPGYSPCLPVSGDLDCADVRALGKARVSVTGSDPYRLDGDGDGVGCE